MKTILVVCTVVLVAAISRCSKIPEISDGGSIITNKDISGTSAKLSFVRGSAYGNIVKAGPVKLRINPQIVVWIEDSAGNMKQTIYVTHCFAKQEWRSIKNHPDSTYRMSSFPYWLGRLKNAGIAFPTQSKPIPDAITAATPKGSFSIETTIDSSITGGTIWCEFNSSFDNNETWPAKGNESFNGQPSLLFSGDFSVKNSSGSVLLKYRGHGGDLGTDGKLYENETGITTAKEIISKIEIEIKRP